MKSTLVSSFMLLASGKECFEWNNQMWEGVARKDDPVYTVCGLEECNPCVPRVYT